MNKHKIYIKDLFTNDLIGVVYSFSVPQIGEELNLYFPETQIYVLYEILKVSHGVKLEPTEHKQLTGNLVSTIFVKKITEEK